MSLVEATRPGTTGPQPPRPDARGSISLGLMGAALVFTGVLTSSLVALRPELRFESQVTVLLPLVAWAAVGGVAHLIGRIERLVPPWRAVRGPWALIPFGLVLVASAVLPHAQLPWWPAVVAAVVAAAPFVVIALRRPDALAASPTRASDLASQRGTFLAALALMLSTWSFTGPLLMGSSVAVLIAVALAVVALTDEGLAQAASTWRTPHWLALGLGTCVQWATLVLHGTTEIFAHTLPVLAVVVLAGAPLLWVNARDARRP